MGGEKMPITATELQQLDWEQREQYASLLSPSSDTHTHTHTDTHTGLGTHTHANTCRDTLLSSPSVLSV